MEIKAYTLNAFGKTEKGGNPAGVVLNSENLSVKQMKLIAKEVGFSETAFVSSSNVADFKVRFFTPSEEVNLCGHATIATFYLLSELGMVNSGKYTQETKAGVLDIEVMRDKTILMTQSLPEFFGIIDKVEIADSLNISVDNMTNMPVEIVSTGLRDIIVPIRTLDSLLSIKPNFDKISKISEKYGAIGYHVFTLETKLEGNAHSRNFAPLYSIPEESATGTATGALSSYLFKHGVLSPGDLDSLIFEQGYSMDMPSEIMVSLSVDKDIINKVRVGGKGSNIKEITVKI